MTNENDKDVEQYEGYDIIDTGIIITKTGDGLSETMRVAPVSIEPNAKAQIVVGLSARRRIATTSSVTSSPARFLASSGSSLEATGAVFTKKPSGQERARQDGPRRSRRREPTLPPTHDGVRWCRRTTLPSRGKATTRPRRPGRQGTR